jgi:hypothetical protein
MALTAPKTDSNRQNRRIVSQAGDFEALGRAAYIVYTEKKMPKIPKRIALNAREPVRITGKKSFMSSGIEGSTETFGLYFSDSRYFFQRA